MGQHNSFKKDIDMLSEAYHKMYGKGEVVEEGRLGAGVGSLAGGALGATAIPIVGAPIGAALGAAIGAGSDEEAHDKTGGKSDHDLLDAVEKKHTAGKALLDKARGELDHNGSLSSDTRDSLARDEYASWADEDAELIHGNKPLTRREKDQHDAERAGVVPKTKRSFPQKEHNPWDDIDLDDDEDAESQSDSDDGCFDIHGKKIRKNAKHHLLGLVDPDDGEDGVGDGEVTGVSQAGAMS